MKLCFIILSFISPLPQSLCVFAYLCVSLSTREHISTTTVQSSPNFWACYPSPWLSRRLVALRYVMYFLCYG